jgi:hypothetical protein
MESLEAQLGNLDASIIEKVKSSLNKLYNRRIDSVKALLQANEKPALSTSPKSSEQKKELSKELIFNAIETSKIRKKLKRALVASAQIDVKSVQSKPREVSVFARIRQLMDKTQSAKLNASIARKIAVKATKFVIKVGLKQVTELMSVCMAEYTNKVEKGSNEYSAVTFSDLRNPSEQIDLFKSTSIPSKKKSEEDNTGIDPFSFKLSDDFKQSINFGATILVSQIIAVGFGRALRKIENSISIEKGVKSSVNPKIITVSSKIDEFSSPIVARKSYSTSIAQRSPTKPPPPIEDNVGSVAFGPINLTL